MTRFRWILSALALIVIAFISYRTLFMRGFQFGGFPPARIIVHVAELHNINDEIEAIGTAKSNESVDITTSLTQTINRINFEEGQKVEKGMIIIEMSSTEAKASLEEAEKQFKRVDSLMESAATTQSRRDQQLLALQLAQSQYEDCMLRAPFSGTLGLRQFSEGAVVSPGTVITTLDDISAIKLDFTIPEKHISAITPGKKITATSVAYPGKSFDGTVYVVDPRVDPSTRAVAVKATVPNGDNLLRPGMLMHVKVILKQDNAILLPEEAIKSQKDKKFVYIIDSANKIEQRPVEIGCRTAGCVKVISGIQPGEQVVMEGSPLLRPGQAVLIVKTKTIQESGQDFKTFFEE